MFTFYDASFSGFSLSLKRTLVYIFNMFAYVCCDTCNLVVVSFHETYALSLIVSIQVKRDIFW